MAHTKGPWKWLRRNGVEKLLGGDGGAYEVICGNTDPTGQGFIHCSTDDAFLVQAAPTLLAALEPFCSGTPWGLIKAAIVNGAADREQGIAWAKRLTELMVAADEAVALAKGE